MSMALLVAATVTRVVGKGESRMSSLKKPSLAGPTFPGNEQAGTESLSS